MTITYQTTDFPQISSSGLQSAGGHLKELQRALKNPANNMGMIVSEGMSRARRAVGLTGGVSLDEHVHKELQQPAQLAGRVCWRFWMVDWRD